MADADPYAEFGGASDPYAEFGGSIAKPTAPTKPVPPPQRGTWEALARAGAQGAQLGFGDEISGLQNAFYRQPMEILQQGGPKALLAAAARNQAAPSLLTSEGRQGFLKAYRQGRDEARYDDKAAAQGHPAATLGGYAAGGLATLPFTAALSPLRAAAGAPLVARMGLGALNALAPSALSALGGSDADLTRGDVGGAAKDTTLGTLLGVGLGGAFPVATRLGGMALQKLGEISDSASIAAAKRLLSNGAHQLNNNKAEIPDEVATMVRDEFPALTAKGVLQKIMPEVQTVGDAYGATLERLEQMGFRGPDAEALARQFQAEASRLDPNTANESLPALWRQFAARLQKFAVPEPQAYGQAASAYGHQPPSVSPMGLRQAENVKRSIQDMATYGLLEDSSRNSTLKQAASAVRQANEDAVARQGADAAAAGNQEAAQVADSFVPLKQRLGRLFDAQDAAAEGAARASRKGGHGMNLHQLANASRLISSEGGHNPLPTVALTLLADAYKQGQHGINMMVDKGLSKAFGAGGQALLSESPLAQALLGTSGARATLPELIEALRQRPEAQQP